MWLGNLRAARIKPDHTDTCVFYQFDIVSDDYYSLTRFLKIFYYFGYLYHMKVVQSAGWLVKHKNAESVR